MLYVWINIAHIGCFSVPEKKKNSRYGGVYLECIMLASPSNKEARSINFGTDHKLIDRLNFSECISCENMCSLNVQLDGNVEYIFLFSEVNSGFTKEKSLISCFCF